MTANHALRRFRRWVGGWSLSTRVLVITWGLFGALVLTRIHGSSIALAARIWAPAEAEKHYLATPVLEALGPDGERYRSWLMAKARTLRSDEWISNTLWALAQHTHAPRFPVRNMNFGDGTNMLLVPTVPVAHVASIARPQTWGYFIFGRFGGLAWSWWFPPFFCFTMLFCLLRVALRGEVFLPALGAFWFCGSAYVILWSNWPAYDVGFGALLALGAYYLVAAERARARVLAGFGVGVALSATAMRMYPPWSIPTSYAFLALFIGLVVRDRLWRRVTLPRVGPGLAMAVGTAALLIGTFLHSSWDDLRLLTQTVYPGARRTSGGDFPLFKLMGGFYNFKTSFTPPPLLQNGSEAAGFFLLFPTVALAVLVSPRVRRGMDAVGWSALVTAVLLSVYLTLGFPLALAELTLLSRVTGVRGQLAVGVLSIVATVYTLRRLPQEAPEPRRRALLGLAAVVIGSGLFYFWQGSSLQTRAGVFKENGTLIVAAVSLGATLAAALLYLRRVRLFAALLTCALVATAGHYNPLSRKFPSIESSEMRRVVRDVLADEGGKGPAPIWLASGGLPGTVMGNIVAVMGARTLTGTFLTPQLSLWKKLDPNGTYVPIYNRYAEVHYWHSAPGDHQIRFLLPGFANFNVYAPPNHPRLRAAGARYALTYGSDFQLRAPPNVVLHRGHSAPFTVWKLTP